MRKFTLFIAMVVAMVAMAEEGNNTAAASDIVSAVSESVTLSPSQQTLLQQAAEEYVGAVQIANIQYSNDAVAMVNAKAEAWSGYIMQLRSILSDEQYTAWQQARQAKRQAVINSLNQSKQ